MKGFLWKSQYCRYFLHGILFSLIFVFSSFTKTVIYTVVIGFGSFIVSMLNIVTLFYVSYLPDLVKGLAIIVGFILGLSVLLLIVGGLNVVLTCRIWSISVKTNWKRLLVHGIILLVLLAIVHIPTSSADFQEMMKYPISAFIIAMFLVVPYSFIDGFLARNVANLWREKTEETSEQV